MLRQEFVDLVDDLISHAYAYRDAKPDWSKWQDKLESLRERVINEWERVSQPQSEERK